MKKIKGTLFLLLSWISFSTAAQSTAEEWYDMGLDTGKDEEKIRCFDNAIRLDENYSNAYYQKGLVLIKLLRRPEAITLFSTAIDISPKKEYLEARGDAYLLEQKTTQALNDFDQALNLAPKNTKLQLKRCIALVETAKYAEAESLLTTVLQIEPLNNQALVCKGRILYGTNNIYEAKKLFEDLIKKNPSNTDALAHLGRCYELENDIANATLFYQKTSSLQKNHLFALAGMARINARQSGKPCNDCTTLPSLNAFARKYCLAIGNSSYKQFNELDKQPHNDAKAIGERMKKFNVETQVNIDLTVKNFSETLESWYNLVENADVVFLFYAGHGFQKDGMNFLVPVDAAGTIDPQQCITIQAILEQLQRRNVKYVVFIADACRSHIQAARGFTPKGQTQNQVEIKPKGVGNYFMGFATAAGKEAMNGNDSNGVYTTAILKCFLKGRRIDDIFRCARGEVEKLAGKIQLPESTESMSEAFVVE